MNKWILLLALLGLHLNCAAEAPVWKVSKDDQHLYLAGTVHFLAQQDYPLPEAFETAYREAEVMVFEVDPDQVQTPEAQQQMLAATAYPPGESLQQKLTEVTYQSLGQYSAQRGLPIQVLNRMRPGMVVAMLTALELQRHGLAEAGVDLHLHARAKTDAKPVMGLEALAEQIRFLADMGAGQEDQLLSYTLRDLHELPRVMSDLVARWRVGDLAGLVEIALNPYQEEFPGLMEQILYQRNRNWMPHLEAMLGTPQTELVLVGALHLATDQGLLAQLRALGYTVEMIQ